MKDKPIILIPSIIVYRVVKFIISVPYYMIHYFLIGFTFALYTLITLFVDLGIFVSFIWWKFIKYIGFGFAFPIVFVSSRINLTDEQKLKFKNEKDKKIYEKKMAIIEKKKAIKLKKEKEELAKIEAKRKKEENSKFEEEKKEELKEQQELLKQEKLEKSKAESVKGGVVVSGTVSDNELNNLDKNGKPKSKKVLIREAKLKAKQEAKKRKEELRREKRKLKDKNIYVNENVKIEHKSLKERFNGGLDAIFNGVLKYFKKQKNKISNNALSRNKKNQDLMQREALLISFEGDDVKKSDKKVVYEYVGKNIDGKLIKSYFEAYSKVEVHSFLLSEGFEVYSIKTNALIQFLHGSTSTNKGKIKNKDMIFFLTQLSTYIKAGIPLVEALRILSRQFKEKNYEKIFRSLIYELTMGDNFSDAMAKQGNSFPRILINMVKASEMTGELPETLDDMSLYFDEMEKTKKQMVTALTYPAIVLFIAIAALSFIMIYIVPQFVVIYEDMDNAKLPWITVGVLAVSNFLKKFGILVLIGIVLVGLIYIWMFKNIKLFRTLMQWILMKLPIVGDVVIFNEVTMFTKTFASLLKHNVFITDSMEILNKITNNEIWKMIILDTITNLAKGDKISLAFQDHWAVPIPAYEMIVTGERTGQLPEMMQKVSDYYQELHKNQVGRIKAFIEPILILFLTGAVGLIVLSIVIPMFSMYDNLS
ncbi:MAG: type II secretion system F family protein [Bacilli bacterium]